MSQDHPDKDAAPGVLSRKAVALRYNPETDEAPIVVAKGRGKIAENIEAIAKEAGVAIEEDKELAEYLLKLDLFQVIPPDMYSVVAHILAHIYSMDKKFK